jgi:hypothetical protein
LLCFFDLEDGDDVPPKCQLTTQHYIPDVGALHVNSIQFYFTYIFNLACARITSFAQGANLEKFQAS